MKERELLGEYFFTAGISLAIVGTTLLFSNPLAMLIAGVIILSIDY